MEGCRIKIICLYYKKTDRFGNKRIFPSKTVLQTVSEPIAIKLAEYVAKILPFNICNSELRYLNPF